QLLLKCLDKKQYKYLLVIRDVYRQQLEMFQEKKHSITNRIVNIHQPHIRPMVRGKQGKNVEFGAKLNASLQNGYARIDQLDFEAFNEGVCMVEQIENYKKRLSSIYNSICIFYDKNQVKSYKKSIQTKLAFNRKARKENAQSPQKIRHFKILKS
ncbi:MAG: IS5/IS1182 family transposase, partial [Lutibacter sp.]|nr:IS5/IS1182 family transposase [Lutibacter sp.]